jgi:hypothetical protein
VRRAVWDITGNTSAGAEAVVAGLGLVVGHEDRDEFDDVLWMAKY